MNAEVEAMIDGEWVKALVTTEQAESSYGLPVLVVNGQAYGAPEVEAVRMTADSDPAVLNLLDSAGYDVVGMTSDLDCPICHSCDQTSLVKLGIAPHHEARYLCCDRCHIQRVWSVSRKRSEPEALDEFRDELAERALAHYVPLYDEVGLLN